MSRIQRSRLAFVPLIWLVVACARPIPQPEISAQVHQPVAFEMGQSVFVERHEKDERRIDASIATTLRRLGFDSSSGLASERPADVDFVVTYRDGWMWDIQMYLLDLELAIGDGTSVVYAEGKCRRVSMIRSDAEQMAREIMTAILEANVAALRNGAGSG